MREKLIFIVCVIVFAAAFAFSQGTVTANTNKFSAEYGTLAGAEDLIARAQNEARRNNLKAAIDILQPALSRYAAYPPIYGEVFSIQERAMAADPKAAVDLYTFYALGLENLSNTAPVIEEIRRVVGRYGAPKVINAEGINALSIYKPVSFTVNIDDRALFEDYRENAEWVILTTAQSTLNAHATDPRSVAEKRNWKFSKTTALYKKNAKTNPEELDTFTQKFRVMWTDKVNDNLVVELAKSVIYAESLTTAYIGMSPRFTDKDGIVNFWITDQGEPGGELYNENIYIYSAMTERDGQEWIREIAHEYSHLTLPPVGGYTEPEWSASGYLGELLVMSWATRNERPKDFAYANELNPIDINLTQISTLVNNFVKNGLEGISETSSSKSAMDRFLGFALYVEGTRGARMLKTAFNSMNTARFIGRGGFFEAVNDAENFIQNSGEISSLFWTVDGVSAGGKYYVYIASGANISGTVITSGKNGAANLNIRIADADMRTDREGKFSGHISVFGWQPVIITRTDNQTLPPISAIKLDL